jgi:hypothetical protein
MNVPRRLSSVKLSRYACYLVVQNADPSKAIVAQGQTYFAMVLSPRNHAAGTLRPTPDTGRANGYGKGPFLRGGP